MVVPQQTFGAPQPNIPGNPSKIILNEDEMLIEGQPFCRKENFEERWKSDIPHTFKVYGRRHL